MTDLRIPRDGADLAVDRPSGARPIAVYAHGMSSSRRFDDESGIFDWTPVDGDDRELVRFDARGHGESTGRPVPADYIWTALADDLLAVIDVVSPEEPVDAIGASMGSAAILWAVLRAPHRFRRLVLSLTPTAWETRAGHSSGYLSTATLLENEGLDALFAMVSAMPPPPIITAGGWSTEPRPPAVDVGLLPSVMRGAAQSDLPDVESVTQITHPTLLLPWDTDAGHPVSTAQRLAELLPDATLEIATEPDHVRQWGARAARFLGA
ncbi:MAG: alpha/beta hydrolase [Corynebacteriales bacterium]|nr:alpha/beta hydrolase [Mycobacteriales bacterium]